MKSIGNKDQLRRTISTKIHQKLRKTYTIKFTVILIIPYCMYLKGLPVIQVNHVSLLKHPSNFFGTIQISGTIGHCPPRIGKNEHSLNGAAEIGVSELLPVFLSGRTNPGNVP